MELEIMCIDCEEQWNPDYEPSHCICDDPADDAWLLFIRDNQGKWVKSTQLVIDSRHYKENNHG